VRFELFDFFELFEFFELFDFFELFEFFELLLRRFAPPLILGAKDVGSSANFHSGCIVGVLTEEGTS